MRILFLAPRFVPEIGGVERHVFFVSRELVARGHEVFVLTQAEGGAPESEEIQGVRIIRIRKRWGTPGRSILSRLLSVVAAWPEVFRALRNIPRPDVIHGHDFAFLLWLMPIAICYGPRKWYVTFHGYESDRIPRWAIFGRRMSAALARGNISVGSFIPKWYGTRASVVTYGAVTEGATQPSSSGRSSALLYVGRVSTEALFGNYLRGLVAVAPEAEAIALEAYGEGDLPTGFVEQAAARGVAVRLMGPTNEPEKVYPGYSTALAGGYLGILEAIQGGCYVIALATSPLLTDFYTLHPCFGHGMSVATSLPEFRTAIAAVRADSAARIRLVEEGQRIVRSMTWGRLTDEYERLWGEH